MAAHKKSRFSVDVPAEVRERMAAVGDGIPDATRARLLLEEWAENKQLQERIRERHTRLLQERYRLRHKG